MFGCSTKKEDEKTKQNKNSLVLDCQSFTQLYSTLARFHCVYRAELSLARPSHRTGATDEQLSMSTIILAGDRVIATSRLTYQQLGPLSRIGMILDSLASTPSARGLTGT